MCSCYITDEWSYRGFKCIIMENERLRISILADYGSKIFQFISKETGIDWMYHNPRVECRTPVYGVNVDNWWTGGIDEAIPTGHPCKYRGEEYPYLGEVWSLPWGYRIEKDCEDEVKVHLWRTTVISPLRIDKWISIRRGEGIVHIDHRITNIGYERFEFIWGIHPGFRVEPGYRIDLPAEDLLIEESLPDERLGCKGTIYKWPYARDKSGTSVDMRVVPPPTVRTCDFHYAIKLNDGWLALTNPKLREGFGIVFSKDVFKSVWLWLVYGGWRSLYCVAIEPWTGYPAKLDEAVEKGVYSTLAPGESLESNTKLILFRGVTAVKKIEKDGTVIGETHT
jgi:hypothetical protein